MRACALRNPSARRWPGLATDGHFDHRPRENPRPTPHSALTTTTPLPGDGLDYAVRAGRLGRGGESSSRAGCGTNFPVARDPTSGSVRHHVGSYAVGDFQQLSFCPLSGANFRLDDLPSGRTIPGCDGDSSTVSRVVDLRLETTSSRDPSRRVRACPKV